MARKKILMTKNIFFFRFLHNNNIQFFFEKKVGNFFGSTIGSRNSFLRFLLFRRIFAKSDFFSEISHLEGLRH